MNNIKNFTKNFVKNIIPQILTKELGAEPFHNYSPCPELYKEIMKTLFEKYFIEAGNSEILLGISLKGF